MIVFARRYTYRRATCMPEMHIDRSVLMKLLHRIYKYVHSLPTVAGGTWTGLPCGNSLSVEAALQLRLCDGDWLLMLGGRKESQSKNSVMSFW